MITAKEAKELSDKNKLPLEKVYEIIKTEAEQGMNKAYVPMFASDIIELVDKGYKVSFGLHPFDRQEMYVIQW